MNSEKNKEYWEDWGAGYSKVWFSGAKQEMSKKELGYINYFLNKYKFKKILDIGIGNGRILENIVKNTPPSSSIFGIDISENMVNICREKFKNERRIKNIKIFDISQTDCLNETFDFITAIRILKYNKNWPEILEQIYKMLNNNGILIFTMPNIRSVSALRKDSFSKHNLPINYANRKQITKILRNIGLDVLDITGFSKIPDIFYNLSNNYYYVFFLLCLERFLEIIFGKKLLTRHFFIACIKK